MFTSVLWKIEPLIQAYLFGLYQKITGSGLAFCLSIFNIEKARADPVIFMSIKSTSNLELGNKKPLQ